MAEYERLLDPSALSEEKIAALPGPGAPERLGRKRAGKKR